MTKRDSFIRTEWLLRAVLFFAAMGAWLGLAPLHTFAAAETGGCSATSESRQLDYFLGDWTITNPGGSGSSTSQVSLSLDQCLFIERWDSGGGHMGQDMFAYNPDQKSWNGMFSDNQGRVHLFVDGTVAAGSAEFHGPSRGPNGEQVLNRVRLTRITPNKLEQTWEKSTDNGATWKTVFSGVYSRKGH